MSKSGRTAQSQVPRVEEDASTKPITTAIMQEFQNLKDKFKNEDDTFEKESPFQHLEKATVLQECRVFHDASVVTQNPRKCCLLLTKLLFLLVKGESFSSAEVTEVFFGVTKLFQSDDVNLRRMMYLFIKEIAETCNPDDVIIVTSSLTKDMNTGEDLYRANSMRVLAKIIDSTMLGAIERYLKQAIVDRNPFVASSALMAGLRLFLTCPDVVRRWINEVQEAVNSSSEMVQFHALSLLSLIKSHDRLAVTKIVTQMSKSSLRSPLASCLLIRYTSSLLSDDTALSTTLSSGASASSLSPAQATAKTGYQFLEGCLRHKSEMVIFEAARAICRLPLKDAEHVNPAITVLQLFLSSPKPSLRFSAMRTLSEVAVKHPGPVAKCNDEMEGLVSDANRSIATLAITTLLKTGTEGSIDRLMKQISSFMSEIGDEFKIVVVTAIRELCVKYPSKHRVMVTFLSTFLREEGGYEFKKAIVDAIIELIGLLPETKESSLLQLCEFIEDCEFDELIVQILHFIGASGPSTASPSKYIRFVFNRVILERASVRAAAVNTLGLYATRVPSLRPSILGLLTRSLQDEDDEVRDRATIFTRTFEREQRELKEKQARSRRNPRSSSEETQDGHDPDASATESRLRFLLDEAPPLSFSALDRSLRAFMAHPSALTSSAPLTFSSLPLVEEAYVPPPAAAVRGSGLGAKKQSTTSEAAVSSVSSVDPAAHLYKMPEFSSFGRAFRSSAPSPLTETEVEYVVSVVKHVFEGHVVLQFQVLNTIDDQRLKNVRVELEGGEGYETIAQVPAPFARYGEQAQCYVALKREEDTPLGHPSTFECRLHFDVLQVNPTTGELEVEEDEGYEEDSALEAVELLTKDFIVKFAFGDFRKMWEGLGQEEGAGEVQEKFGLPYKKLDEAVTAVIDYLGMQPVDGTGTVAPTEAGKRPLHSLHLSGTFIGNVPVLVRCMLTTDEEVGVVLKMAVRSKSEEICRLVADCIN